MMDHYAIVPIDIDFAGWSQVPEGEHNAWGVVHLHTQTLRGWYKLKAQAEEKLQYIMSKFKG